MKLRLVKVVCQPHFVVDDGEELREFPEVEPIAIAAKFWPDYPTTGFVEAVAKLEAQLNEPSDEPSSSQEEKTP